MDKNGNLTSVDTYDSDFTVEEIEEQTANHFRELESLMNEDTLTRDQKIAFLLDGEKEIGIKYTNKYSDFSNVSNEELNEMVEELDWLWK